MDGSYASTSAPSRHALSQQQVDEFATTGYLRVGKILDDRQIEFLRVEYDLEIERARKGAYLTDLASATSADSAGNGAQMLQVYGIATINLWFRRLAYLDKILDIVDDLIGPNIRLLDAHLLFKPPARGSEVRWHHDNVYHQCVPANMISAWLTLDDVDAENGVMQMLPGSHLRPLGDPQDEESYARSVDPSKVEIVALPAGGIMFHHCQVLHGSSPNRSARPRRAVVIRFVPLGTQSPRLAATEWRFFAHPIVRLKI